jgi:hypothetical protein
MRHCEFIAGADGLEFERLTKITTISATTNPDRPDSIGADAPLTRVRIRSALVRPQRLLPAGRPLSESAAH